MAQKVMALMEGIRAWSASPLGPAAHPGARSGAHLGARVGRMMLQVALTVALGVAFVVLVAGAALAQTGGGGGFDPKGMALGFAEVVGWVVLAIGIIVAAKALWNESLVRAVVAIFGAGLFCFVALNVEKLQGLGEWAWSLTGL
jgi:hypothetical protein